MSIRLFGFFGYDELGIQQPTSAFMPDPPSFITRRLADVLPTCRRIQSLEFDACQLGFNGITAFLEKLPDSLRLLILKRMPTVDLYDGQAQSTSIRQMPTLACLLSLPASSHLRVRCPTPFASLPDQQHSTLRDGVTRLESEHPGFEAALEANSIDLDVKVSVLDGKLAALFQAHCDRVGVVWERSLQ